MNSKTPVWPDYLMIRDTGLNDDLGGLGQRIYTTAGAGYEKRKYVREDLAHSTLLSRIDALRAGLEAAYMYRDRLPSSVVADIRALLEQP